MRIRTKQQYKQRQYQRGFPRKGEWANPHSRQRTVAEPVVAAVANDKPGYSAKQLQELFYVDPEQYRHRRQRLSRPTKQAADMSINRFLNPDSDCQPVCGIDPAASDSDMSVTQVVAIGDDLHESAKYDFA